jgi:hypothetical protein
MKNVMCVTDRYRISDHGIGISWGHITLNCDRLCTPRVVVSEYRSLLGLVGSSIVCSETVYLTRVIVIHECEINSLRTYYARTYFSRDIILIKLKHTIRVSIAASTFFPLLGTTDDRCTRCCPQSVHVSYTYTNKFI